MSTSPNRPPFDSNRAWSDASGMVSANREVLAALAGVFLVVPAFAIGVLSPMPQPQDGADLKALLATMGQYYEANTPYLIAVALTQMIGTLAMLALFTDSRRPTVGEAIRQGFRFTPTAIAAKLILGFAVGAMLLLPVLLGGATKSPAFTALGIIAGLALGLWAIIRLLLVDPVVVVDRCTNPLRAMQRSWQLTEGQALRLLAFYVLVLIGMTVVAVIVNGAAGLVLAYTIGAKPAELGALLIATLLQSAMSVLLVAISAACHRQLAGPSSQSMVDKFE